MNENRPKDQAEFPVIGMPSEWGLTKREYFAAMALQGALANSDMIERVLEHCLKNMSIETYYARGAIKQADALIKELEK